MNLKKIYIIVFISFYSCKKIDTSVVFPGLLGEWKMYGFYFDKEYESSQDYIFPEKLKPIFKIFFGDKQMVYGNHIYRDAEIKLYHNLIKELDSVEIDYRIYIIIDNMKKIMTPIIKNNDTIYYSSDLKWRREGDVVFILTDKEDPNLNNREDQTFISIYENKIKLSGYYTNNEGFTVKNYSLLEKVK